MPETFESSQKNERNSGYMTSILKFFSSLFKGLTYTITRLLGLIGLGGMAAATPLLVPILAALSIGVGAIGLGAGFYSFFKSTATTQVSVALSGFNPVNKLFTYYVMVPHIDPKMGQTTTNKVTTWIGLDTLQQRPTGYCYRLWQVGIGYENLTALLDQYHSGICAGDYDKLPQPIILSAESTTNKNMVVGDYTRKDCDWWESEDNIVQWQGKKVMAREAAIMEQLVDKAKVWNTITQRSQQMLGAYLRLYCPLDQK